jgi:hypothetical protein
MALVLGALPFAHAFGPETGLRLFVIFTILVMTSGVVVLHKVVRGEWSLIPCAVFLLVYNRLLLWGFLSFLFALGLAVWGVAAWIKTRGALTWLHLTITGLVSLVVGLGHLFAFGVYLLLIGGCEFGRLYRERRFFGLRRWREAVFAMLPALTPIVALFLWGERGSAVSNLGWRSLLSRLEQWANPFIAYHLGLDVATFVLLITLAGGLALMKRLSLAPPLVGGLVLLAMAQLVMPEWIGEGAMADRRIPLAFMLFALAGIGLVRSPRWLQWLCSGVVLLVLLARITAIAVEWRQATALYTQYERVFEKLPVGTRLLTVTEVVDRLAWAGHATAHIDALAVVGRDAFVPSLFALPVVASQHIAYRPHLVPLVRASTGFHWARGDDATVERARARLQDIARCYEFVLINGPDTIRSMLPPGTVAVDSGEGFTLFKWQNGAISNSGRCMNP